MSTIVTRSGKGSPLTHVEVDANFTNLNTDKYQEGSAIGGTTPAAGTFTTLTATGQTSLGGAAGSETVRVNTGTNTGKYTLLSSDVASNTQLVGGVGGTGLVLFSSATNNIRLRTNGAAGNDQMLVAHTASAVNYVQVTGAATGNDPLISCEGSDANRNICLASKGAGAVIFATNTSTVQFRVLHTGSAVNYGTVSGSAVGFAPVYSVAGSDTNISQVFQSKGTGAIDLAAGSSGVNISNGGTVTAITRTAGGTGYATAPTVAISAPTTAGGVQATATVAVSAGAITTFTITNAGSGYVEQPTVSFSGGGGSGAAAYATVGSNTTIKTLGTSVVFSVPEGTGFAVSGTNSSGGAYWQAFAGGGTAILRAIGTTSGQIQSNGAVPIQFSTNAGSSGAEQLRVSHTASAVNYVQVTGAATGSNPVLSSQGSDTNIGMRFYSKGAVGLSFWTSGGSSRQFQVEHTGGSVVNYAFATGSAAGAAPIFGVAGSDTNIDLTLTPKGTGKVVVSTGALSLAGLATIGVGNSTGNKNYLDNGNFDIWQVGRTSSTTTSNNILPDRWQYINDGTNGSAIVFSQQTFTLGQTDVPNNPKYYLNWAYTSVSTPSNYIRQRVEGVNTMQGQQITISAWLKVASGTALCGFGYQQEFGSGGSPSAGYYPAGNSFTVTTTWQRFTYTVTVASIAGKTLGTNNNDGINICLFAPVSGASGTLSVSQFQCELGPVATSFDLRPIEYELARCQRHWLTLGSTGSVTTWAGMVEGTGTTKASMCLGQFPVTMRANPSITFSGIDFFSPASGALSGWSVASNRCSTTTGAIWANITSGVSGQACVLYIPTSGYIVLDAQL